MKRGSLLHSLSIWVSSVTSIFAGHSLMAKGDSIKELTKTSKKLRPSQSQSAGKTPSADARGMARSATREGRSLSVEEGHCHHHFLDWEKPTPNNPCQTTRAAGTLSGPRTTAGRTPRIEAREPANSSQPASCRDKILFMSLCLTT